MLKIDANTLRTVAPTFSGEMAEDQTSIIATISPVLAPILAAYRIDRRLRIAHFLAQICHESAGLRTTEEFASGAAYEGRVDLGNVRPGDGVRFKGRGLLMLTGRANYHRFGEMLGLPLEDQPDLAADPIMSLRVAGMYWRQREINDPADRDDLLEVTRRINGGLNGLADRRRYLGLAKAALARLAAGDVAPEPDGPPVLRRGDDGEAVADLQTALRARGYEIAVDGDFGPATELAVKTFQKISGLVQDGIAGPRTFAQLAHC